MSEQIKGLDRRWFEEVWNQGNVASFEELDSPDLVVHDPPPGITGDFEGIKQAITIHQTGFPDLHFVIEDQVAAGDKVVSRWTITGSHQGDWVGIPATGNRISIQGMSLQRYQEGKVVEVWLAMDMLGGMQQLGVVPTPG